MPLAAFRLLAVALAGATPAFARAGGWGTCNAMQHHHSEMCACGRIAVRGDEAGASPRLPVDKQSIHTDRIVF